jgi:hypothetical protein
MQTLAPTWNLSHTATTKWYLRLFPSLNDIAFLLPLVVLFAKLSGTQLLFSDGDTGWHIRTGQWILAHHAVPKVDLFSFTKPNDAWFAWEWAWDVVFATIHRFSGLSGVGFITALMLGLVSLLVYRLALRVSHNNVMSMVVTIMTAAVSSIHWLARPHLVSWIFTLLFLHAIESANAGRRRSLYLLPILMVVWVNVHAGFIAGLLILASYGVGEGLTACLVTESAESKFVLRSAWQRSAPYWRTLVLCAAATLVNPYGWQLHKHIYAYLTDSDLLDNIQEFQSISFHYGPARPFEIMLLLGAFAVFAKLHARSISPVLLICLWAHFALLSARHIPIFAIVAAPFVAALLADSLKSARAISILTPVSEVLADICNDLRAIEFTPRLHIISAAALLLLAALFAGGQAPFAPQFNAETFPVQAIPLLERDTSKRVFTTDQWGDYLLYRFYPAQRVFFDGRSDFYGNEFAKVNQRIAYAEHDWKSLLMRFEINLVMLKPETPLSAVLKLTPGSKVLLDDGKVIVFDISGLYRVIPGTGDTVKRAASLSQTIQPAPRGVVITTYHLHNPQKGKPS